MVIVWYVTDVTDVTNVTTLHVTLLVDPCWYSRYSKSSLFCGTVYTGTAGCHRIAIWRLVPFYRELFY